MSCTTPSRVRFPRKLENKKKILRVRKGGGGGEWRIGGRDVPRSKSGEEKKVDARPSVETRAEQSHKTREENLKKPQPK